MEAYQQKLWGEPVKIDIQEPIIPINDPRPDLKYDSHDWVKFLSMAKEKNKILYCALHGFRCGGLRLHKDKVGHVLKPEFDPNTSLWQNRQEYESDRNKWLLKYKDEIIDLLNKLGADTV